MFSRKKIILFVSKSKIIVYRITVKKKSVEQILGEYEWTKETLEKTIAQIIKKVGKNIRLLVDDSLTYIAQVPIPPGQTFTREVIRKQAHEIIPEPLTDTIWNFRDISAFTRSENKSLQVVALVGSFYTQFSALCNKYQIRIEIIEPLSFAIAQSVLKEPEPVVLVYIGHGTLFMLVYKGVVLATEKTSEDLSVASLTTFLNFVTRHAQMPYKKIILSGAFQAAHTKVLLESKITSQALPISPQINLASKERPRNKDDDFFNFDVLREQAELEKASVASVNKPVPNKEDTEDSEDTQETPPKKKSSMKNVLLILFLIILWSGMGYFGYTIFMPKPKAIPPKQSVAPTVAPQSTPKLQEVSETATKSAEVSLVEYSFSILNGSGVSGEANKLSEILKEKGATNIEVGNASQTSDNTVIASKKEVSEETIISLDNLLSENYDNIVRQELPNEEISDIVITIGIQ